MLTKEELAKIISDTADEVLDRNSNLLEGQFETTIELSVKISSIVTINVLQKLGLFEVVKD